MSEKEIIELYEKRIELFLSFMGIHINRSVKNTDMDVIEKNKSFVKRKMMEMESNNLNEELFDIALDRVIPYVE